MTLGAASSKYSACSGGGFGVKGDKMGNIYMVQGAVQPIMRSCTSASADVQAEQPAVQAS